jgi:hypothetical protein
MSDNVVELKKYREKKERTPKWEWITPEELEQFVDAFFEGTEGKCTDEECEGFIEWVRLQRLRNKAIEMVLAGKWLPIYKYDMFRFKER